ncbi:saccharopine dehydrogenase NADP-binding domain-containing protein [Hyphococcus flavus]|uniref:Saccharopine dehydrogenase NADP-binding domain-containing protein n=1 Tax=Hyphococcus flavus TaxID=1866326 RepID=A0AAE9ZG68_9PROT|nr:saccharopine dehydrogenase NADP-binding domain-containing protein [Hyphococcus flavus]WDI32358.1 saccharopine dehydrogenase NADP-binding domain-containing protein [Hyphococcus flavus]
MTNDREFDVIVWGASGFTGRLVAEYLNRQYGLNSDAPNNVKWAMAGRNAGKLGEVAESIGAGEAPLITAEAGNAKSLGEMARRAKAIVTTVGPYQLYGEPLVAACAAAGTDYVDLSGEPPFMRRMIDTYQDQAAASGARIVHSCGFDSIPFDLGVYYVQKLAREKFGRPASEVKGRVLAVKGGASGGTVASMLATMERIGDPFVRKVMRDPYSLAPDENAARPRQPGGNKPHYDADAKKWVAPFIMAPINTRNVHRSNMLMDYAYGGRFRYSEMMAAPNGPAAYAMAGGMGGFAGALAKPPSRVLLKKTVLPKPGEGPSKAQREAGFYKVLFIARDESGETVSAVVKGDRDPGYGSTSKLIAEAALCLAFDISHEETPGGVSTPAAAMGDKLITRLQEKAGLTFEPAE